MAFLAGILGRLTGLYTFLIMIRIVISWFSRGNYGKPQEILCRITDPYLNWFRRFPILRTAYLDLSPIAAMAALSFLNSIFATIAGYGRISMGLILALLLSALWSAASFLLGFFIIVLILQLAASRFRLGGIFWNIIDAISRPLLHRTTRIFFRRRLVDHRWGIILSLVLLALGLILGGGIVRLTLPLLKNFPV